MRFITLLFLLVLIASCSEKDKCNWLTVADLDKIDFKKCKGDSSYLYMQKFSGGNDSMRRQTGIPLLPKDFEGRTIFIASNHVVWLNVKMRNKADNDTSFKQPFLNMKLIEWSNDTLINEATNFSIKNDNGRSLTIKYFRDTIKNSGAYNFEYLYTDDSFPVGKPKTLTKQQSDSILSKWGLSY